MFQSATRTRTAFNINIGSWSTAGATSMASSSSGRVGPAQPDLTRRRALPCGSAKTPQRVASTRRIGLESEAQTGLIPDLPRARAPGPGSRCPAGGPAGNLPAELSQERAGPAAPGRATWHAFKRSLSMRVHAGANPARCPALRRMPVPLV